MELNGDAKIAGYEIQVLSESFGKSVSISEHPVEEGFNISDHVEAEVQPIKLKVNIVRPTFERAQKAVDYFEKKMLNGEKVTYQTGKKTYTNLLIESIDISRDSSIDNGYSGSITLKKVRIAQQSYIPPKQNSQIKKVTNSGRKQTQNKPKITEKYHTIRRGETYWGIAPKYGTTWQEIQKLNPGVDPRKLQIGQKVRVA
jgi:LysM repeat protein